jgi:hypothetical protein
VLRWRAEQGVELMLTMLGGGCLVLVVLAVGGFFAFEAMNKKKHAEALAARGDALGEWTVYYDVKGNRIGLGGTFPEAALLKYMLFRIHDLIDYNRGLAAEQRRLGEVLIGAARGSGEPWQLVYPVAKGDTYHANESPNATLFKYFDGTLYEHAIDQPRFLGGDSIAKAKGMEGECVALIQHFAKDPSRGGIISQAVVRLVEKELREGNAPDGARFWNLPNETYKEITGPG